jgi:hypothetical protein
MESGSPLFVTVCIISFFKTTRKDKVAGRVGTYQLEHVVLGSDSNRNKLVLNKPRSCCIELLCGRPYAWYHPQQCNCQKVVFSVPDLNTAIY